MPRPLELLSALLRRAPAGAAPFLAVGLAGLAADTVIFNLLHAVGLSPAVARVLSLGAATVLTWTLNRRFSFARTGRREAGELGRYVLVALGAQGLSYAIFLTLASVAPEVPLTISLWIGAVLAAAASYAGQRWFTFAPRAAAETPR